MFPSQMPRPPLSRFCLAASDYAIPPPASYRPPKSQIIHALLGSLTPPHSTTRSSLSLDSLANGSASGSGAALEPGYGSDEELQALESPLELLAGLVGRHHTVGELPRADNRDRLVKAAVSRRSAYRRRGVQMLQEVWSADEPSRSFTGIDL